MPLGTVDRTPPPLFRQGPSALSKLMVLSALSILLMVVDLRLHWSAPLRSGLSTVLYPLQWLALQPIRLAEWSGHYLGDLERAQQEAAQARAELTRQAQRAALVEHLSQENRELRVLLDMRERLPSGAKSIEVLYETADPYSRQLVVNRGSSNGIQAGSPVIDGYGVLGQVTRVYPWTAEVTLLIDRHQAISVINTRTGQRSLAYGAPSVGADLLELRFVLAATDIEPGDILTTSGVDGVYPAGLPVAKVKTVVRSGPNGFAQVLCEPMARMRNAMHALVLSPQSVQPTDRQEAQP